MITVKERADWEQALTEGGGRSMKTQDEFDCVEMKRRIQAALVVEECGMKTAVRNREAQRRGLADPVMGTWIANLLATAERRQPPACVAEASGVYMEGPLMPLFSAEEQKV